MIDAPVLEGILENSRTSLLTATTQHQLTNILNNAFSGFNVRCRSVKRSINFHSPDYGIGGFYCWDKDQVMVEFSISKKDRVMVIDNWDDFKFLFTQVLQHELIHRYQFLQRDKSDIEYEIPTPADYRLFDSISIEEEREYLTDSDEIDAYAHDIAMEILYYYPHKNPVDVLRRIDKVRKVWTYSYYKKTFRNLPSEWAIVKRKILKKAFLWIPHTVVYR
jgi:hypothetical protein